MRRRDVTKPRDVTTTRAVWGAPLGASHAGFGLALCVRVVLGFAGAAELGDGQVATHVGPRHVRTAEGVERMRLNAGQRAWPSLAIAEDGAHMEQSGRNRWQLVASASAHKRRAMHRDAARRDGRACQALALSLNSLDVPVRGKSE